MSLNEIKCSVIQGTITKMLKTIRNCTKKNDSCNVHIMNELEQVKDNLNANKKHTQHGRIETTEKAMKTSRNLRTKFRKIKFSRQNHTVKRIILKCRLCGSLSKTKTLLLKHLQIHVGTPLSCKKCKKCFNSRAAYLCHLSLNMCKESKPIIKTYNCDQCPKIFRFKRHFERHVEGHKRNNCTYCDARLTRRKQLVHHLMSVHSIKLEKGVIFACEYCEKRYTRKRSLYYHLKQHAGNKIVCMECGFMSTTLEEYQVHFVEHDNDRPWKCEKCNDRFSRRQQYLIHLKRHDRYKCLTCNETFASKARVMRHKKQGHSVLGLEPQIKCPHCPMAFQRRLLLQIHMKKHSEEKLMFCKYCNKKFHSPYLYFKHCKTAIHEMNSPEKQQLVCEVCGKLFTKRYQLEQHLHRVYDHKKQFTCEYCTYKTISRKNMERHQSLHLDEKREIICEKCGKAFYDKTTLKDHMAYVHSHERHFKCDECDKAFKRNSELVRHKTTHSELRPHVCKICGVSYKRSTHLRRHEESQHGTVTKTRRVQKLRKDENGLLVPVIEEKKPKKTKKKTANITKQVVSIMDAHSGEMVTFTLPHGPAECNLASVLNINNQTFPSDLIQSVDLSFPSSHMLLNEPESLVTSDGLSTSTLQLIENDSTFNNSFLGAEQFVNQQLNQQFLPSNLLPEQLQLQAPTCDILLPEPRLINFHNLPKDNFVSGDFTSNSFPFL